MDGRAGPGGLKNRCRCCGLDKSGCRAARSAFKRELKKEMDEAIQELWDNMKDIDPNIVIAINEEFWDWI